MIGRPSFFAINSATHLMSFIRTNVVCSKKSAILFSVIKLLNLIDSNLIEREALDLFQLIKFEI